MKTLKIKSMKLKEVTQVYDMEIPKNHNFILENGVIAHNCSYSIVAYNGAYIKYHYPLHFYLGELSIRTDDDLKELADECRELILPVDIHKSHHSMWTIDNHKLRPPLSLIKGVGEIASKCIYDLFHGELNEYEKK